MVSGFSKASFQEQSATILGVGSVAFALWALASPHGFARFMGTDPAWGRVTGVRDLVIGSILIVWPSRLTLAARAAADAWDASTVAKPGVALGAAAFSCWATTAALAPPVGRARQ